MFANVSTRRNQSRVFTRAGDSSAWYGIPGYGKSAIGQDLAKTTDRN